jgi:hypothetical protein
MIVLERRQATKDIGSAFVTEGQLELLEAISMNGFNVGWVRREAP